MQLAEASHSAIHKMFFAPFINTCWLHGKRVFIDQAVQCSDGWRRMVLFRFSHCSHQPPRTCTSIRIRVGVRVWVSVYAVDLQYNTIHLYMYIYYTILYNIILYDIDVHCKLLHTIPEYLYLVLSKIGQNGVTIHFIVIYKLPGRNFRLLETMFQFQTNWIHNSIYLHTLYLILIIV